MLLNTQTLCAIRLLGITSLGLLVASVAISQQNSPTAKEVLQTYRQLDSRGGRLTVSGWYAASKFFVKPAPAPQRYILGVMSSEHVDDSRVTEKNRAKAWMWRSALGQVDASGRFTSIVAPRLAIGPGMVSLDPAVPPMHGPTRQYCEYELVFTDTYWEFGPKGEGLREVKESPQWRLSNFEYQPWVTRDVAVRYLTQLHDKSSNRVFKSNLEQSIRKIRSIKWPDPRIRPN
jgi:hypothetical protein